MWWRLIAGFLAMASLGLLVLNLVASSPGVQRWTGTSMLTGAVLEGNTRKAERAIRGGANVNARCAGPTLLIIAIDRHQAGIVDLLLAHGADPDMGNDPDEGGDSAWSYADHCSDYRTFAAFMNHLKVGTPEMIQRFVLACAIHDAKFAQYFIDRGVDVNAQKSSGISCLHYVGSKDVAKLLLQHSAKVNTRNNYGETPLHTARNAAVARLFLEHGADLNIRSHRGRDTDAWVAKGETPIETAKREGRWDVVEVLKAWRKK